jgi:hypothetical protein
MDEQGTNVNHIPFRQQPAFLACRATQGASQVGGGSSLREQAQSTEGLERLHAKTKETQRHLMASHGRTHEDVL